ncbi:MAG: hypothetical protein ABIR70_07315 [Bryobacteraceae bacterium]
MKYVAMFLLVFLAGSFAQIVPSKPSEDVLLPNGRRWNDAIAEADYRSNLKDARALADLTASIRDEIEASDKFVLSLKTLRKVDDAEKLIKSLRTRMGKN